MNCDFCGKEMFAPEAMIDDKYYCHTFSEEYPTCYMKANWGLNNNMYSEDDVVSEDTQDDAMAKHWDEAQQELYDWMYETAKEWYHMGIVNDKQYIGLMLLLHEVDKKVYYDFRREQ